MNAGTSSTTRPAAQPAPLDERIARLYYGRSAAGGALASPSPRKVHTPRSSGESRLQQLHSSGTISSSMRAMKKPEWAKNELGDATPQLTHARPVDASHVAFRDGPLEAVRVREHLQVGRETHITKGDLAVPRLDEAQ